MFLAHLEAILQPVTADVVVCGRVSRPEVKLVTEKESHRPVNVEPALGKDAFGL